MSLNASSIEPFKTAITFRFNAPLMALIWVGILLIIGLFVERAYCRVLCRLGGSLAIFGKVRMFNFLNRRIECGNPCKACNVECPTQAIKSDGNINMNECFQCLDCGKLDCVSIKVEIPKITNRKIETSQVLLLGKCESCLN